MKRSLFFEDKDEIQVSIQSHTLYAFEKIPSGATQLIVIAHGSGSSRFSPRDQYVSKVFYEKGFGVFFMDLLTVEEERIDDITRELRFNIQFLADRMVELTHWLQKKHKKLSIGYFGASTGAAAAIVAAVKVPTVKAIVSRGGRPDLAKESLKLVQAATLFIVGGDDLDVLELNQVALDQMHCKKKLEIVPGATHLFEEAGTLEQVADLSCHWFLENL